MILQQYYQAGESGASIGEDVEVWFHIMEELEKDGDRLISYIEFYDTILVVIQRGYADEIILKVKRDKGLRQSILYWISPLLLINWLFHLELIRFAYEEVWLRDYDQTM